MNPVCLYLGYGLLFSELALALWRRSTRKSEGRSMDAGSLRVLWIVTMSAIMAGVWLALRGIGPRLPTGPAMEWGCSAVFAVGTALRWWAIFHLGRFFTVDVAVSVDHRVVDTGPYRLLRHPSYSGLWLQFAGFALTLGNGLSVAVILFPISAALLYRIRVEETALRNGLGEAYTQYMGKTKRLIPWVF